VLDQPDVIQASAGILNPSASLTFPINTGTYDLNGWALVHVGSQLWCKFDINAAHDGSSGATYLSPDNYSSGSLACNASSGHSGTLNFYWSAGNFLVQNNTSLISPITISVAIHTGAY
jgi:hypothetical protein